MIGSPWPRFGYENCESLDCLAAKPEIALTEVRPDWLE
jgi:hypothetical protein